MFIQTEETPNPQVMKFIPGKVVMAHGVIEFNDIEQARVSPLASSLLNIDEISNVFFGNDFITVTKSEGEWQHLKPAVLGIIMEHFVRGLPTIIETNEEVLSNEFYAEKDTEIVIMIKELLEARVRPAVAQDGGDISFRGFEDGIVFLHLKGACSGCPSATITLKNGIENLLRHFIPEVEEVRQIEE